MASSKQDTLSTRQASLLALSQVLNALTPFSDHFVLIGGWAPYLLLQRYGRTNEHIGSADLDLVFNGPQITPTVRDEILAALTQIGCQPRMWDNNNLIPFPDSYLLPIKIGTRTSARTSAHTVQVQIDVIGLHQHPSRKLASHYALALKRVENIEVRINNKPVKVPVSGAAAVFAMKAMALANRQAPKDAYDLYMISRYYKQGPASLAQELKPLLIGPPIRSAALYVRRWFSDRNARGPKAVVDFLLVDGSREEQEQLREEVYLTIKALLDALN